MLVCVRPSNEALLRARVPGAQDQHGCPPILYRARSASKKGTWPLPSPPLAAARCVSEGVSLSCWGQQCIQYMVDG